MSKNSKYYDLDDEQKAVVAEYVGSISKNKYSTLYNTVFHMILIKNSK